MICDLILLALVARMKKALPHLKYGSGGNDPVKGDVLVLTGAMLYAVSNVSEVTNFILFS